VKVKLLTLKYYVENKLAAKYFCPQSNVSTFLSTSNTGLKEQISIEVLSNIAVF